MIVHDRRANRETPYRREHERSASQRMETGVMPKSLDGLLAWFAEQCSNESPDRLHVHAVWKDRVTQHEQEQGIQAVGGSDTGAPAYSEPFRKLIENAPSETDQDGYYLRPLASALSRIARRGNPLMARHLMLLAWAGFDWRKRAGAIGWADEEYEVYLREALIRLFREYREQRVTLA